MVVEFVIYDFVYLGVDFFEVLENVNWVISWDGVVVFVCVDDVFWVVFVVCVVDFFECFF